MMSPVKQCTLRSSRDAEEKGTARGWWALRAGGEPSAITSEATAEAEALGPQ